MTVGLPVHATETTDCVKIQSLFANSSVSFWLANFPASRLLDYPPCVLCIICFLAGSLTMWHHQLFTLSNAIQAYLDATAASMPSSAYASSME